MIHPQARIHPSVMLWCPELSNIGNCEIGEDSVIHSHVWIADGVKIGKRVKIQAFTFIPEGVQIEDDVFIGPRVTFTNDKYPPSRDRAEWWHTYIKNGAAIGASVTILPGITVGQKARVGAGALVTKDIPDRELWIGVPAKRRD